jgi:hypothetical protein
MKVGFFTLIKWAFAVRDEINAAFKDDKQISAKEMVTIYKNLSEVIKIPLDPKLQSKIDILSELVDEMEVVVADNKITVQEIINTAQKVCDKLGYHLDDKGFNIPEINKPGEL